jgi:hypothetical protein
MILTKEKIESVAKLLNASNVEDRIVGYSIIENIDWDKELVPCLLLYKKANVGSVYEWSTKCERFYNKVIIPINSSAVITFNDVVKVINEETPLEHFQMFKDYVEEFIADNVTWQFKFIDNVDVSINPEVYKKKAYDKDRVTS